MKSKDLIRLLEKAGFKLQRHGANHDIYINKDGVTESVPRRKEIKENLAKDIIKRHGLK